MKAGGGKGVEIGEELWTTSTQEEFFNCSKSPKWLGVWQSGGSRSCLIFTLGVQVILYDLCAPVYFPFTLSHLLFNANRNNPHPREQSTDTPLEPPLLGHK